MIGDTLVEVKCPVIPDVKQALSQGKMIADVQLVDGEPSLKENGPSGYYLQMQLGMLCTGSGMAKFVIWTKNSSLLLDVPFNQDYVARKVDHLQKFYFEQLLPRVVDEYSEGRFVLSRDYKILAKPFTFDSSSH
jgi:hypothetical protein